MSTELTTQQKRLAVGNRGVSLSSFEDAWRFSQAVIESRMAPPGYTSPHQVLIGIQRGAEIGLPPMQALDVIAVINNRPTVYGDGIPALVESSGMLEDASEWIDGEGDNRTAHCRVKRRGQETPLERTFSVADAKKAKLWGKAGPWTQYPDRMLTMRARAFAYRDKFADCLRGIQIREEVEDYASSPIPAEVTEPAKPRLLSEIPVEAETVEDAETEPAVERSKSFVKFSEAIEKAGDDWEELQGFYPDIAAAEEDGSLTVDEAADLRDMLP